MNTHTMPYISPLWDSKENLKVAALGKWEHFYVVLFKEKVSINVKNILYVLLSVCVLKSIYFNKYEWTVNLQDLNVWLNKNIFKKPSKCSVYFE